LTRNYQFRVKPVMLRREITVRIVFLLFTVFCLIGGLIKTSWALTTEEEKKLGKRILLQMERNVKWMRDPALQAYVDKIGHSIVKEIGSTPFDFKFYLVMGTEPNAYAIPGGHIFLTSGLILLAENDQEVAGVMSHEIAHVTGRHLSQLLDRSKGLNIASLGAAIAAVLLGGGGTASQAIATTAMATSEAFTLKYTRENETDADQNGLRLLVRAGYDPEGMITFLNKIYKNSLISSPKIPPYLSTHPAIEDRIAFLQNLLHNGPRPQGPFRVVGNLRRIQTKVFVEEKEPHLAVNYFESMVKTNPRDVEALFGLGLSLQKMGRLDRSLDAFQAATSIVPEDPDLLREMGIVYFLSGKMDESLQTFKKLRELRQNDLLGNYYMGKVYQEQGKFEQALSLFHEVHKQMPESADVALSLGSAYGRTGQKGLSHFYFGKHFKLKREMNNALLHFRTCLEWLEKDRREREEAEREIKELTSLEKKAAEKKAGQRRRR
jgi:predicted Zn-dependent protease